MLSTSSRSRDGKFTRVDNVPVSVESMVQLYHGHRWTNMKMKSAFRRSIQTAMRCGGQLPVIETRGEYGRWHQSVEGSRGVMFHKAARDEADVVVPDGYIIPPINFHRHFRWHIFWLLWDDVDIVNCHFVLVRDICALLGIPCDTICEYIENREAVLQSIIDHCGGKISRDDAKMLFIRILFSGHWKGFVADMTRERVQTVDGHPVVLPGIALTNSERREPDICKRLFEEVTEVATQFAARNPEEYTKILSLRVESSMDFSGDCKTPSVRKTMCKVFSVYVQTKEREIIDACTRHCIVRCVPFTLYMYDGFLVAKGRATEQLLLELSAVAATMGFNVRFEVKPMSAQQEYLEMPTELREEEAALLEDGEQSPDQEELMEAARGLIQPWLVFKQPKPSHASVAELFLLFNDCYAYGGDFTYRICPTSGRHVKYESEDLATKQIGERASTHAKLVMQQLDFLSYVQICSVQHHLETQGFKNSTAEAVRSSPKVIRPDLSKLIDADADLIGFENGVLSLTEAREALARGEHPRVRPAVRGRDFVCKSTGYDFEYAPPSAPERRVLRDKLAQCLVRADGNGRPDARDALGWDTFHKLLRQLGSALLLGNPHQVAMFLIGVGANGKSVLLILLKLALGEYAVFIDNSFWTQPIVGGNSPAPLTLKMKGARVYLTSEIDKNTKINAANFKSVVAGDEREARALHSNLLVCVEFGGVPIFGINEMPECTETGYAIVRRAHGTEFPFVFTSDPAYQGLDTCKPSDDELASKPALRKLAPIFFSMLLDAHFEYVRDGSKWEVSKQQSDFTATVHNDLDPLTPWLKKRLEAAPGDPGAFELTAVLHSEFCKDTNSDVKPKAFAADLAAAAKLMGFKKAENQRWAVLRDEYGEPQTLLGGAVCKKKGQGYNFVRLKYPEKPSSDDQ